MRMGEGFGVGWGVRVRVCLWRGGGGRRGVKHRSILNTFLIYIKMASSSL